MKHDQRDVDGRYANGLDAMCVCGHSKGSHLAEGPVSKRACIAHELDDGPAERCGCEGFRKQRVGKRVGSQGDGSA